MDRKSERDEQTDRQIEPTCTRSQVAASSCRSTAPAGASMRARGMEAPLAEAASIRPNVFVASADSFPAAAAAAAAASAHSLAADGRDATFNLD